MSIVYCFLVPEKRDLLRPVLRPVLRHEGDGQAGVPVLRPVLRHDGDGQAGGHKGVCVAPRWQTD